MPVRKITQGNKTGYRWGTTGKIYPTRRAAEQQGRAIYASGYKTKKK